MASEWTVLPLEECMDAVIDYRGKTPEKTAFGVPLITAKVVKGGRIETPNEFIAECDYAVWMRRGMPMPGDVVITTEAPLGEVAQIGTERVALAQRLIALRGKSGFLDNGFLKFLMQSEDVQAQLRARSSGTTVLGIKQSELRKVRLTLPSFPCQRAIAHILGTLDDKIELNRRMNETLEAMARALFKSWFVDFDPVRAKAEGRDTGLPEHISALFPDSFEDSELGEIPKGWQLRPVGDLAEIVGGTTPSTKVAAFWDGGSHAWATPKDLSGLSTSVLLDTNRRITDAGLAQIGSGLLPEGTVLLSSRAPIGYLAIAEVPVAINQGFIAMKPSPGVSNLFLLEWARAAHDEIVSRANGSTFLEISKTQFRSIPVVVPSSQVLEEFDRLAQSLFRMTAFNEQASHTLTVLRDTLLPQLLSGSVHLPPQS